MNDIGTFNWITLYSNQRLLCGDIWFGLLQRAADRDLVQSISLVIILEQDTRNVLETKSIELAACI